jgi:hypothetical protein
VGLSAPPLSTRYASKASCGAQLKQPVLLPPSNCESLPEAAFRLVDRSGLVPFQQQAAPEAMQFRFKETLACLVRHFERLDHRGKTWFGLPGSLICLRKQSEPPTS